MTIERKKFRVERVVFYNKDSQWGVLATSPIDDLCGLESVLKNKYGNITVLGNFENIYEGAEILVSGEIGQGNYGKEIRLRSFEVCINTESQDSIINFLHKSAIKGINIKNAQKIYKAFKDKAIDVVLHNPDSLKSIAGIGDKTINKIKRSVEKYKSMQELVDYCTKIGIPYSIIKLLDTELGDKALDLVKEDPYKILDITNNISFHKVDQIYINAGGNPTSRQRLSCALLYVLKNMATLEGSTGCYSVSLRRKFYEILSLSPSTESYSKILSKLYDEGKVSLDSEQALTGLEGVVYYKPFLDVEFSISEGLTNLEKYGLRDKEIDLAKVEEEIHNFPFTLNEQQERAVRESIVHSVTVLTGAAGCVAGDTIVRVDYGTGDLVKTRIEHLYKLFNDPSYTNKDEWRVLGYEKESDTDNIVCNEVESVTYSGVKKTYKLTLSNGSELIATPDHRVLTHRGYVPIIDLVLHSDAVLCEENGNITLNLPEKIVEHGTVATYDIGCVKNHNFVANGIVIHNSGKSSITKALANIYARNGFNLYLLSATAKACRRLEECTGRQAQTIHKFLCLRKDSSEVKRPPVEPDTVIIIDEASMVDIHLFRGVLSVSTPSTRIILIGDNNQLPSVQAGNVLGDVIDSNKIHVSKLTDVMRQKQDSHIIEYCTMINNGEVIDPCEHPDFHYEEFGDSQELLDFFYEKYASEVSQHGLNEVQVITAYKKRTLGMDSINQFIQNKYNPNGLLTLGGLRLHDKVRHTINNYNKEVFNGETGVIVSFNDEEEELVVDYGDRTVVYDDEDVEELTLAYASTVHASQGSEYKVVFVILDDDSVNDFLYVRRLLYTAVSRGKKKVYVLSKPYMVDKCINNGSFRPRITKLKDYLEKAGATHDEVQCEQHV